MNNTEYLINDLVTTKEKLEDLQKHIKQMKTCTNWRKFLKLQAELYEKVGA